MVISWNWNSVKTKLTYCAVCILLCVWLTDCPMHYLVALLLDVELSSGYSPDASTSKSSVVCCFLH